MQTESDSALSTLATWGARLGTSARAKEELEKDLLICIAENKYLFKKNNSYAPEAVTGAAINSKNSVVVLLSESGFAELQTRKSSPQLLYRTGELKVEGDMEQALLVFYILGL